jgi:hypothetical protein
MLDILKKVFKDLIEELRVSNPKKFEEVRVLDDERISAALLPSNLEQSASDQDPDAIHSVELYIANFLSNPATYIQRLGNIYYFQGSTIWKLWNSRRTMKFTLNLQLRHRT